MYLYIVGAGYDIQSDLDLIPTALNFFPVPQSFTLIRKSFLLFLVERLCNN